MVCQAAALVHKVGAVAAEVHRGAAMPKVVPDLQQPTYNSLYSFITRLPIPQSRCIAAGILWQPSSLPCRELSFTV